MRKSPTAIALLAAMSSCGMSGGGGVVLETGSAKPVAGATVTLECRRGKFPEGSDLVKTLKTITGEDGALSFSTLDVLTCGFAYVAAEKTEYVPAERLNLMYSHDDFATIPKQIVLTPKGGHNHGPSQVLGVTNQGILGP